ncbi:hypothetical protein BKA70DRAFT_851226 [Coprinopsis sp. MPI-PUGE-AT-0042]|nr:hypothetical protein BKA70DRAFT_851226 [Coprinopsis sp. MPI-PUGE-AT-0042]
MHPHYGQVNWYRHAFCAWLVVALAGGDSRRGVVVGKWGQRPISSSAGGGVGSSSLIWPSFLGVGSLLLGGLGSGWGLGAEAKPVNVTVGPFDPSVDLVPEGGWTLESLVDGGEEEFQYAVASSEEARASFQFDAIAGTTLYYTSPLFASDTSVTLSLDNVSSRLNATRSRGSTQSTTTILFAQDLRAGQHRVSLSAAVVDGRVSGNITFGFFTYTTDDELLLPASPSTTSSFESFVRPTGVVPLNDTTTTNNVNADGSPRSSSGSNKKLVIPLAVIGALLGLLVIGIFLLWIFKFPHYCCGPCAQGDIQACAWTETPEGRKGHDRSHR